MQCFYNLPLIKFIKSAKESNKEELDDVLLKSSTLTFKGIFPMINSAILQSDKFNNFEYKGAVLICMIMANNMLFSFIITSILRGITYVIFGRFVSLGVSKIAYPTILGITSLFFVCSLICHCICQKLSNNSLELIQDEEKIAQEALSSNSSVQNAISDLSIVHGMFLLFIPSLFGLASDFIVKKCRGCFNWAEHDEFVLSHSSDRIRSKICNVLVGNPVQNPDNSQENAPTSS
ncbi:MAG: hypothetical protein HRK26_02190 [Rickettsiaceae bacterium H1]|nr:hypothetical protein [Rickettsiaceae bacterium H1]